MIIQAEDMKMYIKPVIFLNENAILNAEDDKVLVLVRNSKSVENAKRKIKAASLIKIVDVEDSLMRIWGNNEQERMVRSIAFEVSLKQPIPIPEKHKGIVDRLSTEQFDLAILWSYEFDSDYLKDFVKAGEIKSRFSALIAFLTKTKTWKYHEQDYSKLQRKVKKAVSMNVDNSPTIRLFN